MKYALFASCPKGLEILLMEELQALGLENSKASPQGVYGDATLTVLYQLCLWSRIANRIQLILFSGSAYNQQTLHQLCTSFHWQTVFTPDKTIAIEFHGSSKDIRNTMFGAQVIKDAIVDHFRRQKVSRPSVDKDKPQVLLHAFLKNDLLTLSLDLTGYSLHQRAYRSHTGTAPLKENLAAALLMRANWPTLAKAGYGLHDPFCGSGTLVIEAAMMAAQVAPGLLRQDQAFVHWLDHQPALWEKIRQDALKRVKPFSQKLQASDSAPQLIAMATDNAHKAGVLPLIDFKVQGIGEARAYQDKGLVISNPPYGERQGALTELLPLYSALGKTLHSHYQGWQAAILSSNPLLAKAVGLRSKKQYSIYNGALACKLYCFDISPQNALKDNAPERLSPAASMLFNRLEKNYKHLKKWAKNQGIEAYRVYDADLPEYAYAIDIYKDYVVLQEYQAPLSIPEHKAKQRSLDVIQVVPKVLGIAADKLVIKERKPQRGAAQYKKLNQTQHKLTVQEGRAKFVVNLYDYLDTGLFLDHRPLRLEFARLPKGSRFLNCFCYTATASVHAALAGALTTNVDLSNTYLRWAEDNFKLNHLDLSKHQFIGIDCREWLRRCRDRFDVIFLDPPSFSNSKRMKDTLDVQRDHSLLIASAMRLLNPGGILYFSTNLRQFKLDLSLKDKYHIEDLSLATIDVDFKRSLKIHKCFKIKQLYFA